MSKLASGLLTIAFLASFLIGVLDVPDVRATSYVYIRSDGSIDPPSANISTGDHVNYVLTGNFYDTSIVVEKDNIVMDGANHSVKGNDLGPDYSDVRGVRLTERSNVTMKNIQINGFKRGIDLTNSMNMTISYNSIVNCSQEGIYLGSTYSDNIVGNVFIGCGLKVQDSSGNDVANNTVNNKPLVYLEGVSNYVVEDAGQVILVQCLGIVVRNTNLSNVNVGLDAWHTNQTTIVGNEISGNRYPNGIQIRYSNNITISENNLENNNNGISLDHALDVAISNNNIASSSSHGVDIGSSGNVSIVDNHITNGEYFGIYSEECSNVTVSRNIIEKNDQAGISLGLCTNVVVSSNVITDNSWGIDLAYGSNLTFMENNITNNHDGMLVDTHSSDIRIYHNNFVNNTFQISLGYSIMVDGNYWSDYTGVDQKSGPNQDQPGSDGIGDTPVIFSAFNRDHYPLMNPVSIVIPEFWSVLILVTFVSLTFCTLFANKKAREQNRL